MATETIDGVLTAEWFDAHDRACVKLGICPECAREFVREPHDAGCSLAPTAAQRLALEIVDRYGWLQVRDDAPIASAWVSHDPVTRRWSLTAAGRAVLDASKRGAS